MNHPRGGFAAPPVAAEGRLGRPGGAACDLQQIVRASARPFRIKRLCLLRRDYRLILPPLESHPIGADLGLQIRDGNAVDVLMGVRFDLGFTLQPGKVILRA